MLNRKATVKYLWVSLIAGAALLSETVPTPRSFAQDEGGGVQTLEGIVSDGMCGANHSGRDAAEGTMECVRKQMGWVLVVSDKVYTLEGRLGSGMNRLAGAKAKVTGRVVGNKISAIRVDPAN